MQLLMTTILNFLREENKKYYRGRFIKTVSSITRTVHNLFEAK